MCRNNSLQGQGQLVTGIVLLIVGIHSCLQLEQLATGIHDEKYLPYTPCTVLQCLH